MSALKAWWDRLNAILNGDKWKHCRAPTPGERKALWRIRKGQAEAEEELRKERIGQAFDLVASRRMQGKPGKLPDSKRIRLKIVKKG